MVNVDFEKLTIDDLETRILELKLEAKELLGEENENWRKWKEVDDLVEQLPPSYKRRKHHYVEVAYKLQEYVNTLK